MDNNTFRVLDFGKEHLVPIAIRISKPDGSFLIMNEQYTKEAKKFAAFIKANMPYVVQQTIAEELKQKE